MSKALLVVFVLVSVVFALCYRFSQTGTSDSVVSGKLLLTLMASAIVISLILAVYHLVIIAIGVYQQSNSYDAGMVLTLLVALIPVVLVARLVFAASAVPSIHDISSDTANPPIFQYALAARQASDNSLDYSEQVAEQQRLAYPHIQPLLLSQPAMEVIAIISRVIEHMGWSVQGSYNEEGMTYIEAYDKTTVLGFIDDVVIRVSVEDAGQTRVDMRSASRAGVSDLGTNAQRIEVFMALMQQQAQH